MKIAFVSDTGTGLAPKELEALGVYGVPLQITVDEKTYLENVEISIDEVNTLMKQEVRLKTSLASLQATENLFERLKEEGYEGIFAIPICEGLSGTINMMRVVAEEVGLQFDYFDCHVTAMVERYMIVYAKHEYDQGTSIETIKQSLATICATTNTLLIPNDLQHLKRGGRLTPLAATLGGLLKIKPILEINERTNGKIDVLDKVRTMQKAMLNTLETMKESILADGEGYDITVAHVDCEQMGVTLLSLYQEAFPKAVFHFVPLVSVVAIHTGIGCLAIQYFKREKEGIYFG